MPLVTNEFGLMEGDFLSAIVRARYAEHFRAQVVRLTKLIRSTKGAIDHIDGDHGLNARGKTDRINAYLNIVRPKFAAETVNPGIQRDLSDAADAIPTHVVAGTIDAAAAARHREIRDYMRGQDAATAAALLKTVVAQLRTAAESQREAAEAFEFAAAARNRQPNDLRPLHTPKVDAAKGTLATAAAAREVIETAAREMIIALQTDPLRAVAPAVPDAAFIDARDAFLRITQADKWDDLAAAQEAVQTYKFNAITAAGKVDLNPLEIPYTVTEPKDMQPAEVG